MGLEQHVVRDRYRPRDLVAVDHGRLVRGRGRVRVRVGVGVRVRVRVRVRL